jgi:hypothetical protein
LDVKAGKLLCYREIDSKKKSTWISLLKAEMIGFIFIFVSVCNSETFHILAQDHEQQINVKTKKGKKILMIPLQKSTFPNLKLYLETCFRVKLSYSKIKQIFFYESGPKKKQN